jgi:hypothetical protein
LESLSALTYLFTKEVKAFKTSKRIVKPVDREITLLDFPQHALEEYFKTDFAQTVCAAG